LGVVDRRIEVERAVLTLCFGVASHVKCNAGDVLGRAAALPVDDQRRKRGGTGKSTLMRYRSGLPPRRSWLVMRLAAGLEGLDDDHSAGAVRATVGERLRRIGVARPLGRSGAKSKSLRTASIVLVRLLLVH
jgi:hypothetical protein